MASKDLVLNQSGLPPPDIFMSPAYRYGKYLDIREKNTWENTLSKVARAIMPFFSGMGAAFLAEKALLCVLPATSFSVAVLLVGSAFLINILMCEAMRVIGYREGELYAASQMKDGMKTEFKR